MNTIEDTAITESKSKIESKNTLGKDILNQMIRASSEWMKNNGNDVQLEARMKAWERVHAAIPDGALKNWHGKAKWLSELDARAEQFSSNVKNAVWGVARSVIEAEFPLATILPDDAPGKLDALMAKMSGVAGETAIKGGVKIFESIGNAAGSIQNRIDTIFSAMTSGVPKPLIPQGVQV